MIDAAKLRVVVGADTGAAERDLDNFGKKLENLSRNMGRTGAVITGAVGVPLALAATAALRSAGDFEQSMNVLQQVSGATASSMQALSAQALQLGAETSFSAGEAAEAMVELAKAGMDTEEVMDSIAGVMDLAAAGGIGLAEAAGITAATLNAFGLEAEESARIADLLAATANASAADISDLSQGMRQAGFAFRLANQPVDNLAASLAILTNVGLTGSDAGTALKNAFMRMMNPTAEAASLMEDLGISFYDARGNMRDLPDIIDILNSATANMSAQQRDAALATIFLSDGMKAMIPLMNEGKDGFNSMLGEVTEAGAASEVADARMRGLTGGIEYLMGSIDSFLIGEGLSFTEFLGNLARGAGDAITELGKLPQPVKDAGLAFLGAVAGVGLFYLAMGGLTAAITAVSWPLILLAIGVGLLAAAWATNWGDIQTKTTDAITAITPMIDGLITKLGEIGTAAGAAWTLFTNALAGDTGTFKEKVELMKQVSVVFGPDVAANIANAGTALHNFATGVSTAFANTKFPTFEELWGDFKAGELTKLATTIQTTAIDLLVNLDTELNITGKASDLRAKLLGVIAGVGEAINALDFSGASTQLSGLRGNIEGKIETLLDGINWSSLTLDTSGLMTRVSSLLSTVPWDTITVNFGGLLSTLGDRISAQADALLGPNNLISRSVDRISGLFTTLQTSFAGVDVTQPLDVMQSTVSSLAAIVGTLGAIKGDAITTGIDALHKTVNAVLNFGTLMTNSLDAALIADVASGMVTGLASQIKAAFAPEKMEALGITLGGLGASIAGKLGEVLSAPGFADQIGTAMGSATAAFVNGAAALVGGFMDEISGQDVSKFQGQIDQFILNFTGGLATSLISADWSAVGAAIRDGIVAGIQAQFADRNFLSLIPGPLGQMLGGGLGRTMGIPTIGDTAAQAVKIPEMPRPAWLDDILNWKPAVPAWVVGLTLWSASVPAWIQSLVEWSPTLPDWVTTLTTWKIPEPVDFLAWVFPPPTKLEAWTFPPPDKLYSWEFPNPDKLFSWDWPSMSMPGWVGSLIGALGGAASAVSGALGGGGGGSSATGKTFTDPGTPPNNASGTPYFSGGLTWVGERGPEIVGLPRGSRIWSNQESMELLGDRVVVNINIERMGSDMDAEALANRVVRKIQQRMG